MNSSFARGFAATCGIVCAVVFCAVVFTLGSGAITGVIKGYENAQRADTAGRAQREIARREQEIEAYGTSP